MRYSQNMSDNGYIPAKTAELLASEHPEGTRHLAKIQLALPLLGNGIPATAVIATLRDKFPAASDREITNVVEWCQNKNPTPSGYGPPLSVGRPSGHFHTKNGSGQPNPPPTRTAAELTDAILYGQVVDESDWCKRSPSPLPETFDGDAGALLRALYTPADGINIVTKFTVNEKGKANPKGGGKTMLRDDWLAWFSEKGVPFSRAGAWVRPNPCKAEGSGKEGAICDADISSHRFLMIESDSLPLEKQLALYAKLPLSIVAIILSGGDSAHAWMRLDCEDAETYHSLVEQLYAILAPLGFDRANKNPSRLSRLPGAKREIGATGDGQQRLIFLNPTPSPLLFH